MLKNNIQHIKAIHIFLHLPDSISHESQTMRFPSAIIVAALASLISAIPIDESDETGADNCPWLCINNNPCMPCYDECASISIFPEIDNMTHLHDSPFFSA
jgi:hypothetical protein